jgi:LacI family transcriptional regulator
VKPPLPMKEHCQERMRSNPTRQSIGAQFQIDRGASRPRETCYCLITFLRTAIRELRTFNCTEAPVCGRPSRSCSVAGVATRKRGMVRREHGSTRAVKLKDVALRAGVDASTVSRVLRGDERKPARPETRDLILQAASEMGYRPNNVARSLRTRQTRTLGLVIPDAGNPGFAEIFRGVQVASQKAGWHVIVAEARPDATRDADWDRLLLEGLVDGMLVLVASIQDPVVKRIAKQGYPLVLVNRRSDGVAGSVVVNDARGSEVAVDHFVALGHRKIAHIAGPPHLDTGVRRLAGFRNALAKHGLPLLPEWISETDYTEAGGIRAAGDLLSASRGNLPTAVYVASLMSGLGALRVFRDAGLRIPEDMSLIVSDELPLAAHSAPPLSTIAMPVTRMGEVATNMLLAAIGGEPVSDIVLDDDPRLVLRGSTAAPTSSATEGR